MTEYDMYRDLIQLMVEIIDGLDPLKIDCPEVGKSKVYAALIAGREELNKRFLAYTKQLLDATAAKMKQPSDIPNVLNVPSKGKNQLN